MVSANDHRPFDFDEWSRLARQDPEAFDRLRLTAIEDVLSHGYDRPRMVALQSRIDLERQRARTPLKACLKLSAMMWDEVYELQEILDHPPGGESAASRPSARVLPFKRP
jgi:hypothetical protein